MTFEVRLGKTDVWLGAVAAAGFATGGARSDLAEFFQGGLEMSSWDVSGRKMLEFQALVGKTRRFRFREEVSTDEPFSDTEPTTQLQFSLRIEPFDSYQLRILATFADGPDLARLAVLKRIDVAKVLQGIGI